MFLKRTLYIPKKFSNNFSTKNIVPCVSCVHYCSNSKICNGFYDYDCITGDKIYHSAKKVRENEKVCGILNPILYKPVFLKQLYIEATNLYKQRTEHRIKYVITSTIGSLTCIGVIGYPDNIHWFGYTPLYMILVYCAVKLITNGDSQEQIKIKLHEIEKRIHLINKFDH